MLVEKIVRETLGLKDHRVVTAEQDGVGLTVRIDRKKGRHAPGSGCGVRRPIRDRLKSRGWRHVPLWGLAVVLRYAPCRVRCASGGIRVAAIP